MGDIDKKNESASPVKAPSAESVTESVTESPSAESGVESSGAVTSPAESGVEFIPAEEYEAEPEQQSYQEIVTSDWELTLSQLAQPETTVRIPRTKEFKRQQVISAFANAFELIGGVPRLALWAHSNPTEFFKLYGKLLPTNDSAALGEQSQLVVRHVLPRSPLDE